MNKTEKIHTATVNTGYTFKKKILSLNLKVVYSESMINVITIVIVFIVIFIMI